MKTRVLFASLLAVGMLATACGGGGGGSGGGGAGGGAAATPKAADGLTSSAAAVKDAKTLKATFTVKLTGAQLTGDADVVAGEGKLADFTAEARSESISGGGLDGRLLDVDGQVYERSSRWKMSKGKQWFAVKNPDVVWKPDTPIDAEWLMLNQSRLLDPLFLLDQGVPGIEGIKATKDTLDGRPATKYTIHISLAVAELGAEFRAWAEQTGEATDFDATLWLDEKNLPAKLKLDGSTFLMQFWTEVTYHDYGTKAGIKPPDPAKVIRS